MRCFVLLALCAAALGEDECEKKIGKCFEALPEPDNVNKESCEAMSTIPDCLKPIIAECADSDEKRAKSEGLVRKVEAAIRSMCGPTEEECEKKTEKCFKGFPLSQEEVNKESCEVMHRMPDCIKPVIAVCAESEEEKAEVEGLAREVKAAVDIMCGEPCATPADILPSIFMCIEELEELSEIIGEEDNSIDIDVSEADAQCILGAFLTECAGKYIEDKCGYLIAKGFKEIMMEALVEEGVGKGSDMCEIPTEEKKKRHVMKRAVKKSRVFKRFAKYRRSSRK